MKRMLWVCLLVFGLMLSWSMVYADDIFPAKAKESFYVITVKKCCTCKGTLVGTRWCDNGDGTVTDLTTCLVWLKKADWGGMKRWREEGDFSHNDDAHTQAGILEDGTSGADLSDGSVEGDWRLPTKSELYNLANGTEAVRGSDMRAFTGVQSSFYWSSSSYSDPTYYAWYVSMIIGYVFYGSKADYYFVWPVRSGN